MDQKQLQDKIAFYKKQIAICEKVKSQILPDDPYIDIRLESMNNRIKIYKEEISRLKPNDLTSWTY